MATFTDSTGRAWGIVIPNFRVVAQLRADPGFDLNRVAHAEDGLFDLIYGDAERVVRAAWALAAGPAGEAVTVEQFEAAIDAAALRRLRETVAEAVFDFFHPGQARRMIASLTETLTPSPSNGTGGTSPAPAG